MVVPVMAQTDVEVTDSTSGEWGGGQGGDLDPNHPAIKITAKSYTRVYGEANPTFEFTSEGATLVGVPEITCEATATSPVGTYPIVIKKGTVTNYNDTYVNGTLTITKAPLSVKAGTYTKKQGEENPAFTLSYDGWKNNETEAVLTKKPVATTTATKESAPGEYPVTVSGGEAQNYELSYTPGKLIVTDADAVVVTAKSYTRVYGDANPTFEYEVSGTTLMGVPEITCEATPTSPVGTYPIIIKKGTVTNYNDTYVNGVLTITKAPLTVKAGTYTKKQGEDNPAFTLTYDGWKNSETEAVLTKKPMATTTATKESAPGEYPVTVSGGEAQNYELSYTHGKLIVTDADAVVVTAKSYIRVYGDANPTFEYEVSGTALVGVPEITCEATATSPVGTYPIVIKKGSVTNYNDTYVNGTLTITKAPLAVKAGTYTKKQGEENPAFTLTYDGWKNNETEAVLTKKPTATTTATKESAPGEYPVTISGGEAQNYELSYTPGKLIVTDADAVVITAKSYTRVYGDANPAFEYEVSGTTLVGVPEITCEATATSPVGTYPIVIKKGTVTNYNDTYVNGTLTITKAPLAVKAGTYTKKQGEENPAFTLTYDGWKNNETEAVLTKKPVATTTATKESAPGEYPVTVSGGEAQNYELSYTNGKLIVTDADAVVVTAKSYTRVYGDANPTFEFTSEGATLVGSPEITCEATATSPVGTYPIVIKKGSVTNYNDTYVNGVLTITKAPLTVKAGTYTKKQGDDNPAFTLTYDGWKNNETEAVLTKKPVATTTATKESAPGEYPVTVSGGEAQNYELSYTNGKLIVTDADAVVVTAKSYTRVYGDANPTFEFTSEGATLVGSPEITCEATATSPVGTYPIVIKKGSVTNYNDTYVNGTLTITKAPLSVKAGTYTKKQGEDNPAFTLTYDGWKNSETEAVLTKKPMATTTATKESAPGEYPVTVGGGEAQNYELSYTHGKLIVTDADAVVVTAKSYTRVYGDANPTFEFTSEGATLVGVPEITCEATATSPVGTYPIIIKKGTVTNYNDTYVNGTLTITKAPLAVKAGTYTKKQGEDNPAFTLTYDGWKNGETEAVLTKKPMATTTATKESAPGEYPVTVSGGEAQNYELSYTHGKLIVTDADAVVVTAKSYTRVYGDANPTFEYEVSGATLVGVPEITCEATATSPVGTYPIVIKKGTVTNYNDTYVNGVLTITKAPLTVKAGTYTKKQGEDNPAFTLTYDGWKNNETEAVLTKKPVATTTATKESAPGEYPVTVSGGEAQNYELSYTHGKLVVTDADAVVITAKSYTRVYGDANPAFEYEVSGTTLVGVPEITCEATVTSSVGTYPIVIKKGTVTNYNDTYVNGTLTITKAPLAVKAGTYTKKQGEENPAFTLTYDGWKNSETEAVLTKKPTATTTATKESAPGEYPVTVSGGEAQNYELSYTNGKLIVTDADAVVITAKSYTRVYGDANPTFEFTSEGATLVGVPEITCEATATSPVGTYPIVIKKGTVTNYNDTYVNGTLTITKAPLSVKAGTYTKKQGEDNPAFTLTYDGWKNNETEAVLTKKPTATTTATKESAPGEYPVTVSGGEAQNYELSYTHGKLIVTDADAVVITAKSYTRVYGDANPAFEYEVSGTTLVGVPEITCEATATSPVGTYPIIIKKGTVTNYNDTYVNGTLTITKAPLAVKAGTYTKKQGEDNPAFTLTYDGWKNNETEAVLTKKPTATTTATKESAPGEYPVTVSGGEAQNYELSYTPGKLIVTDADAVVITAKSYTRVYGDANPAFEYEVSGTTLVGVPEIICEATATSPVGTYPIVIKKGTVTNYNDTYVNGTLTITKASLTVSVENVIREQYQDNPEFVITYTGWKVNDDESVLTKKPVATTTATKDSPVGEYEIAVSGGAAQNYELAYQNGILTVIEATGMTTASVENPVDVYTTQGHKVRTKTTTLEGLPKGLYIVNGRKVVVK